MTIKAARFQVGVMEFKKFLSSPEGQLTFPLVKAGIRMLYWQVLSLYFLHVSCMDTPGVPLPSADFVKLNPEYAEMHLTNAEENWLKLENDCNIRLKPTMESYIRQAYSFLEHIERAQQQLLRDDQDLQTLAGMIVSTIEMHAEISFSRVDFSQTVSLKMACLDLVLKSLFAVYHSGYEEDHVLDLVNTILRSRGWLSDSLKELDITQNQYRDILNTMIPELASRLFTGINLSVMTTLIGNLENSLKELEDAHPNTLSLPDLESVGVLIIEYDENADRIKPLADLFVRLCKQFLNASPFKIPNIFKNSVSYSARHLKLCRLYYSIHMVGDLNLAELDIQNETMFNWRRFRNEFYFYFNLNNKADGDLKVYEAMFGKGYDSSALITFTSAVGAKPLDLVKDLSAPMVVNLTGCPHDTKAPHVMSFSSIIAYVCPSVNLLDCKQYCDGLTMEIGGGIAAQHENEAFSCDSFEADSEQSRTSFSEGSSEEFSELPNIYLQMNPKGLEVMREHIYNMFLAAIRNGCTSMILPSGSCETCQLHPAQLADLYKDAALVFTGRGLTHIFVIDSDLFEHIRSKKKTPLTFI